VSEEQKDSKLATQNTNGTLAKPKSKITIPRLHQRVQKAETEKQQEGFNALTLPNRISLQLDISGSMSGQYLDRRKIDLLKDAILGFVGACDMSTTAAAMSTFPEKLVRPLTNVGHLLIMESQTLEPTGSTPMADCMKTALENVNMTRGIIVSDGCADNPDAALQQARAYASAEITVDTVHIGDENRGEELLKQIAEITGGMYIKFTDVSAFAKNFKFLTPGYRAMLTSGSVDAKTLGAAEIKK
jgi:Mg-chelatase subunit ChlD